MTPSALPWPTRCAPPNPRAIAAIDALRSQRCSGNSLPRPGVSCGAPISEDPQLRAWTRDARQLEGGLAASLFTRLMVDRQHGEALGPSQAACWLDVKRFYMQLRPTLRYVYAGLLGGSAASAPMEELGFVDLGDMAEGIGGPPLTTRRLDLGPGSVEGWLSRLLSEERANRKPSSSTEPRGNCASPRDGWRSPSSRPDSSAP